MTGKAHFFIIISIIAIDILGNYYYIEKLNKKPNHPLLWLVRAVLISLVVHNSSLLTWFLRGLNASFMYWFIFDTGLNLIRKKRIDYLGTGSILDRLQVKYLGNWNAFAMKLIICGYTILNMLYNYDPYYH